MTSLGFRLAKVKVKKKSTIKNQKVNALTWVLQVKPSFV
jgi:hypothetical protein